MKQTVELQELKINNVEDLLKDYETIEDGITEDGIGDINEFEGEDIE